MKDLLSVFSNQEADLGLEPRPSGTQTQASGVRKNRGDFQGDVNPHTIEGIVGGNDTGNQRLTGLMEGALEIFQDISYFIKRDVKPAGGHRC